MMFKSGLNWQYWRRKQINYTNMTLNTKTFKGYITNQQHLIVPKIKEKVHSKG